MSKKKQSSQPSGLIPGSAGAVAKVFGGWAARAQRHAVLRKIPGCQPSKFAGAWDAQIVSAMQQLRNMWRGRLSQLKTAGWDKIQSDSGFRYTLNCATFGLQLRSAAEQRRARFCMRNKICPFCWGRDAGDCYERLHFALYGSNDRFTRIDPELRRPVPIPPARYDVFEWRRSRWLKRFDEDSHAIDLAEITAYLRRIRPQFAQVSAAVGSLVLFTVEPAEDEAYWKVTDRCLLLVHPTAPDIAHPRPGKGYKRRATFKRHRHTVDGRIQLNRELLSQIVGRTWQYPVRMFEGNAELTVHLLHELQGFRAFFYSGLLRNESKRQQIDRQGRANSPQRKRR